MIIRIGSAIVYRVFRCQDTGYANCGLPIGFPKGTAFSDARAAPGIVYYDRLRACTTTACSKSSVANPGHRGEIPSVKVDNKQDVLEVEIPGLGNSGRWLLILLIIGSGVFCSRRRLVV